MANVHILQNIKGYRLGSMREQELEKELHNIIKSKAEINDLTGKLQDKYSKQLHTHALELINETKQLEIENTNLISQNIRKDLSLAKFNAMNDIKSKKIRSLESMIKILKGKLTSARKDMFSIQNNSLKKDSEILSLKSKIAEVEQMKSELLSKISELGCLKSEAISNPIVGGDDEGQSLMTQRVTLKELVSTIKNTSKSDNISADSNLSKYFYTQKNMDQIIPKNVTLHLAQQENNIASMIESHPQILMGGIEEMRSNLEASPLPAVASSLVSPLLVCMLLSLLMLVIIWFVRLRRSWGIGKKSERLRNMWIG
ncbi:hypothetical protein Glove_529g19 [Diversispora epigaea]|uniref:Uncharacterized protein n=1 Tax=Diversispora epigaea TaxID=1348612 RepID=A0A397GG85_9GLOM|nr:hypothetical protein Glove_529g19 [Diversispora epigaea]